MTLNCTKTYTSGVTHSLDIRDEDSKSAMARVDAEDRVAGLVGTWDVEVKTVR